MFNTTDEEEEKQDDQDNDDRSINLEETDDEDEYAKYVHDDEYVHDYADEEMKDVENAETGKDDDEVNNAIKADVKKIEEVKGNNKQAGIKVVNVDQAKDKSAQDNQATALVFVKPKEMPELPRTSSSLSVSSGFVPDPLPAIVQMLSDLENQFEAWKQVDHSEASENSVQANIINEKNPTFPTQSFVTPDQSAYKAAESLSELELKNILFKRMDKGRSYLTHDKHQELYDSLLNSIMLDEAIAKGDVNPDKVLKKRDRGDDEDEDPSTGPNQWKKNKRRRTKEYESSKKSSTSKDTSKGNTPPKTSKSDKSVHAEESVSEPI
ncbi:hypothetical protein Tco_0436333 [Tanacetum coccineum]